MNTLLWISLITASNADVAPGPFYREDCTVAKKEQEGVTCDTCTNYVGAEQAEDSSGDDPNLCHNKFEGTNYAYACSTNGASYWSEVWCDGEPKEGCSHMGSFGAGSMLLTFALLLARRKEVNTD